MSVEYDRYLNQHISMVGTGLRWMADNLDLKKLGFTETDISYAMDYASMHDDSKSDADEYFAYDDYFYGGNRSYDVVKNFTYAWLRHLKFNPHHWQYWILINDDPDDEFKSRSYEERYGINVALEIPKCHLLEMIADWWTFSWRNKNLMEIFGWYDKHRNYIVMHSHSRKIVESVLDAMEEKIYMQDNLAHGDLTEEDEKKKYGVPDLKKFPMPDKRHVKSAIKFFNYIDPKHEKELAASILARMKEYGLIFGKDITVGDENRFKKYIPEREENHLEHHGILGMKWGIRRFQNKDGTLTILGKKRYSNTYSYHPDHAELLKNSIKHEKAFDDRIKELSSQGEDISDAKQLLKEREEYLNEYTNATRDKYKEGFDGELLELIDMEIFEALGLVELAEENYDG